MRIGRYNFFEVGCAVDSSDVGDMNEFQFKSIVSEGSKVESFCQITAGVTVPKNTYLKNYSVVYEEVDHQRTLLIPSNSITQT
jgi:carbonic anhydrase/acetyltransferase-like protein (isoleucine patch superfamily)